MLSGSNPETIEAHGSEQIGVDRRLPILVARGEYAAPGPEPSSPVCGDNAFHYDCLLDEPV